MRLSVSAAWSGAQVNKIVLTTAASDKGYWNFILVTLLVFNTGQDYAGKRSPCLWGVTLPEIWVNRPTPAPEAAAARSGIILLALPPAVAFDFIMQPKATLRPSRKLAAGDEIRVLALSRSLGGIMQPGGFTERDVRVVGSRSTLTKHSTGSDFVRETLLTERFE